MKKRLMLILRLPLLFGLLLVFEPFVIGQEQNVALASQSTAASPIRLGVRAQALAKEEIDALERLVPGTKSPWLLMDDYDAAMMRTMTAYLPPEFQTPELRRGTMTTLHRLASSSLDSRLWTVVEANGAYAQVAVAGRSFDQIPSYEDVNRPFRVVGSFDDAELLSIVHFFRTKYPRIPLRAIERDYLGHPLLSLGTEPLVVALGKQGMGWVILAKEAIDVRSPAIKREPVSPLTPPHTILNHVETVPQ